MRISLLAMLYIIGFCLLMIGCSSNKIDPVATSYSPDNFPTVDIMSDTLNHDLFGVYEASFDLANLKATVEPDRDALLHVNIKPYLPAPEIVVNSYNPVTEIVDVDVSIMNPSKMEAYDVRLIIYTDNAGHLLLNADDWTGLFDIPTGLAINPFKAYAKNIERRKFSRQTYHVENLQILLPGGNPFVKFAIEASYPSNCEEPYEIRDFRHTPIYPEQDSVAEVRVQVSHWNTQQQARAFIECPAILGSQAIELETRDNSNFNAEITNSEAAPIGEYQALLKASEEESLFLYDIVTIQVSDTPEGGWAVQFNDDAVVGVEIGNYHDIYTCFGQGDMRIVKHDMSGEQVWVHSLTPDDTYNKVNDIHYDRYFDFVEVAGDFAFCNTGTATGLMAGKYTPDDSKEWVEHNCLSTSSVSSAIASDKYANVYISGGFYSLYQDTCGVLSKLNMNGDIDWAYQFVNDQGSILFKDLASMDSFETIYGIGEFWGTLVDFDPSDGVQNRYAQGARDSFLAEWDSEGHFRKALTWGDVFGGVSNVWANSVVIDNDNNIFVVGTFKGQVDFDPSTSKWVKTSMGYSDIYISKFDSNGNLVRFIKFGSSDDTSTSGDYGNGIALDPIGNVLVTGRFKGKVDFDPGYPVHEVNSAGDVDIFLAKYSNSLSFTWVQTWGSDKYDGGIDVACDRTTGEIVLTGIFKSTLDFDPGEDVFEMTPQDTNGDVFLMKINPNGLWD